MKLGSNSKDKSEIDPLLNYLDYSFWFEMVKRSIMGKSEKLHNS